MVNGNGKKTSFTSPIHLPLHIMEVRHAGGGGGDYDDDVADGCVRVYYP